MSAQTAGKAPSPASPQTPEAQPAQAPDNTSAQTPPEPVVKLADVVKKVKGEGGGTSIRDFIAEGVGIKPTQLDSSPVLARALADNGTHRELYVIDDTGDLLFTIKDGNTTVVYLANRAGVLQTAGYFSPGRFLSQEFKLISKEKAPAQFAAEKEFWIKKFSGSKYADAGKPEGTVSKPEYARPEAVAKDRAELEPKAAREAAALKPDAARAAAEVDEKDKLSAMTPRERIKYLDQQIREAKQEAKLEKKDSAKEKKLAGKAAEHKPQGAKDDKSAEKNPQAVPADSNQQSNSDADATPTKKKISWF